MRLLTVSVLAAGGLVTAEGQAATAGTCLASQTQLQQVAVSGQAPQLKGSVPVLFVHGINSDAGVWQAQSPTSLAGQVARLHGFTGWTFNYGPQSLEWVTNPAIGPALASAISCLGQASGNKVIVVAHSMGGLAAQYAVGEPGSPAAGHVAEVITLGTPFTGSEVLTIGEDVINGGDVLSANPVVAMIEALLSACAGVATTSGHNYCWLASVLRAPIGAALESNSPQIKALPPWPPALPVFDIAGNMDVVISFDFFGYHARFHAHPGDGAVTLSSATAYDTAGSPYVVSCSSGLVQMASANCFHTSLPDNPAVISHVLAAIRGYAPLAPGTYPVNRQISSAAGWVLTLDSVRIASNNQATFLISYHNVSSSTGLTCTGDTNPAVATITSGTGDVTHSIRTYCSDHPNAATINVPVGHALSDYGVFPATLALAQPFDFYWYAGTTLSGTVTGITLTHG